MPPLSRKLGEPLPETRSLIQKFFGSKAPQVQAKLQADPERAKAMDRLLSELLSRHAVLTEALKATPKGPRRAALMAQREEVTARGKQTRAAKAAAEAPPRGTSPKPEPNIGDIIPAAGPRLSTKDGRITLEVQGVKMTLDDAEKFFQELASSTPHRVDKAVFQQLGKLKELEATIQQLPMIEGGRLASFEQAAALRAARQADPSSAHFDPNRQFKFKGKPPEAEEPRITTPGQRVARDISGSMRVPSRVEETVSPAATELIKQGTEAIHNMDVVGPQQTAQTVLKIMGDADVMVRKGALSKEVADSVRNRLVESIIRMPQGKDLIQMMRSEEIRSTSGPKFLAQDAEGNFIPREEGTSLAGDAVRALGRLVGLGSRKRLGPEDRAAEREARALRGKPERTKKKPLRPPPTAEERARPVNWPANIARPRGPAPERPPLFPPQIADELAKAEPDVDKIARILRTSKSAVENALERWADARARLRYEAGKKGNKPYLDRVVVFERGKLVGHMTRQEAQDLVESTGKFYKIIPARLSLPMSEEGIVIQDKSSRSPGETSEDGWALLQRLNALLRGGRTPFAQANLPLPKNAPPSSI